MLAKLGILEGEDKIKTESTVPAAMVETQNQHEQLLARTMKIKISWSL